MSESKWVDNLYIITAIVIVFIILYMFTMRHKKDQQQAKVDFKLAVKTSKGLIKMNNSALAGKLRSVESKLQKFKNTTQPKTFAPVIEEAVKHIKQFLKANPGANLCTSDERANIVHQAMLDSVTTGDYLTQYKSVLEHDSIEHQNPEQNFEYMLKHISILIKMLHNEICEDGIFDLDMLEKLLYAMDEDMFRNGSTDITFSDEAYSRADPYAKRPELPWEFIRENGQQLEGFTSHENDNTKKVTNIKTDPIVPLMEQSKRFQEQSQEFRTNTEQFRRLDKLDHLVLDPEVLLPGSNVEEL